MRISIRSPKSIQQQQPSKKGAVRQTVAAQPLCRLTNAVAVKSFVSGPRNLRHNGTHRFIENAEVLCIGFQIEDQLYAWCPTASGVQDLGAIKLYTGLELPAEVRDAIAKGAKFIAHTCELERAIFRRVGLNVGPLANWIDTSAIARTWMLPDELSKLAVALDLPEIAPIQSSNSTTSTCGIIHSCISEVVLIGAIAARYHYLLPDDSQSQNERRFFEKHLEINERGIRIDLPMVEAAAHLAERELSQTSRKIERITDGAMTLSTLRNSNPDSGSSLSAVLRRTYGFNLPACDEDSILDILEAQQLTSPASDNRTERRRKRAIKAILWARLRVASTGLGKLDAMLNQTSGDGRLRGQYVYYGSHTGRSSSRGVQLQNFSRPKEGVDIQRARDAILAYGIALKAGNTLDIECALQALRDAAGERGIPAAILACTATALVADPGHLILMADAAQIENRVLYWLAGDNVTLNLYREFDAGTGKDPYCAAAAILKGGLVAGKKENPSEDDKYWRKVGKVSEISLGYQMGSAGFAKRCTHEGIDLTIVNMTPEKCVSMWRDSHEKIAGPLGIWQTLEHGVEAVVTTGRSREMTVDGARMTFVLHKGDLQIRLPSGRHLIYPNARMAPSTRFPLRQQVTYDTPIGPSQLYGGLITENIVQAIAADCFRFWILLAEQAGLKVIGHTHDEIIIEVHESEAQVAKDRVLQIIKIAPDWAPSLPVNAEADKHSHYRK